MLPLRGSILWRPLSQRPGNLVWDGIVRGSGVLALLAIPGVLWLPESGPLVGFVLVTIWVNGPISPLLPATYEPILMLYGRLYTPLVIGLLGIGGTVYVEYLNYHLYRKVLDTSFLARLPRSSWFTWVVERFKRAPFFTIWLCSWSPLPYWPVRFLSPLARYPVGRHLSATFLGRFPRLVLFAALGSWWDIELGFLVGIAVASIATASGIWFYKARQSRAMSAKLAGSEG